MNNYFQDLLLAIEAERKNEEDYYAQLALSRTESDRIASGLMFSHLSVEDAYYTLGEKVELKLRRHKQLNSPHQFKVGAGAQFHVEGVETHRYRGTISFIKRDIIGIIFNEDIIQKEKLNDSCNYKLELIYDERPYKVMKEAINDVLISKQYPIVEIREGILKGHAFDGQSPVVYDTTAIPSYLNKDQENAIRNIIKAERLGIIHGPPGTGKTSTIVGLIITLLTAEKRVLACASSNNAVDLLAKRLDLMGVNATRIGNVTRINDDIAHLTLDEKMRNHGDWQHIKKVKIEAEEARRMAGTHKRSFGQKERQNRTAMYRESRELRKWARDLEDRLVDNIIESSQVVLSTLIGLSTSKLDDIRFDTVIIDEVSQALDPECWNAILRAKRVFLVGDHMQLPPTVKSQEARNLGLETTLLDKLSQHVKHSYLLREQYRMNDHLLAFSNQEFYDNQLKAASTMNQQYIGPPQEAVTLIDTTGCGFEEAIDKKSLSKYNEGEFFILREHIYKYKSKYETSSIGIISPYSAQVKFLKTEIEKDDVFKNLDITINTIDGFQGQERDVIFLSLVRNNLSAEIGFLKDYRRLNVAITRAKKKIIIIGDVGTLSGDDFYMRYIDHIERHATYESAWEYMS